MNLARDFDEPARGVKVIADRVLRHRLDDRVSETFAAEIVEGMLDEPPAKSLIPGLLRDREIRDASLPCLTIDSRGNIADNPALRLRDEDPCRVRRDILIHVPRLPPFPIMAVEDAQRVLDILLECHAGERLDSQPPESLEVGGLIEADADIHDAISANSLLHNGQIHRTDSNFTPPLRKHILALFRRESPAYHTLGRAPGNRRRSVRRRGILALAGIGLVGACVAGVVWATWPEPADLPDWSNDYDLTARHPGELPAGTVVGSSAPEGWSHLIIKSLPRVHARDRDKLLDYAADKASWMFTAFVADVVPESIGPHSRYKLRAVALGLGASVNGRDIILKPDSGKEIGASLGPIEREILTKGYAVQRKAVMVVHGPSFGLVDTPVWFRCGSDNRLVRYRYALLVDTTSGRLDVLVWRLQPEDGSCGDLAEVVRLNPDTIDAAELVVDPRKVTLGIPGEDALAVETMPPGRRLPFPAELRGLTAQTRLTSEGARDLETRLRSLLAE